MPLKRFSEHTDAVNEATHPVTGRGLPTDNPETKKRKISTFVSERETKIKQKLREVRDQLYSLEQTAKLMAREMVQDQTWKNSGDLGRCVETLNDISERLEWVDD